MKNFFEVRTHPETSENLMRDTSLVVITYKGKETTVDLSG